MATTARNRHGATSRKKYDPYRQASRIRTRLRRSVKFVTPWPRTTLRRWKGEGRIFSVRWGNRDLYPAFQFGTCDFPWGLRKILRVVPKSAQGWPLLSWFEAGNVLLNGRKPSRVLKTRPDQVLEAAEHFYVGED